MSLLYAAKPTLKVSDRPKRSKDLIAQDPIVKEANKRIAAINREHTRLNEKIAKRAKVLLQKSFLEAISRQRWLIHGVDMYRKDIEHFQLTLSACWDKSKPKVALDDLVQLSDKYCVGPIEIDGAAISVGYDCLVISAGGDDCQNKVFSVAKTLRLKIDYASYIKTTEAAETEIAARKKLIDDLSTEILFAI